jgi:hypothetical protein
MAVALTYYVIFYPIVVAVVKGLDAPADSSSSTTEDSSASSAASVYARVASGKQISSEALVMVGAVCSFLVYQVMKTRTNKQAVAVKKTAEN